MLGFDRYMWRSVRRCWRGWGLWLALCGCSAPPSVEPTGLDPRQEDAVETRADLFLRDVTSSSGIDFAYRNGDEAGALTLLETLGGGVGLFDYDRDGWLDVFLPGGGSLDGRRVVGRPGRMYRNLGSCRFEDVTEAVGLHHAPWYSHGVAAADYDGDGWTDLLLTGYGGVTLYRNEQGKFRDVTAQAGLKPGGWPTSGAWGDLNGDGKPDLFIAHYVDWSFDNHPRCPGYVAEHPHGVCSPRVFQALPDIVYLNQGDGTFRDASDQFRLRPGGKGLGVLLADLDDDDRPDIYVANDTTENFLYLNRGHQPWPEVGLAHGVALNGHGIPQGSMGVDISDADGSGRFSIFVTNFQNEAHAFYRALGQGRFQYASEAVGVTVIGFTFVGFGTGFADFDRDGREDILIVNGHISQHPAPPSEYRQRPVLFRHVGPTGSIRYHDVSHQAGDYFQGKRVGRGLALGDLDNDGRLDVVISHINEPAVILRNESRDDRHWLGLDLVGQNGRDVTGARVIVESHTRTQSRQVKGGGSYLSTSDRRLLFGLDTVDSPVRVTVRWPYGSTQTWEQLPTDRYWRLVEGVPEASWSATPTRRAKVATEEDSKP